MKIGIANISLLVGSLDLIVQGIEEICDDPETLSMFVALNFITDLKKQECFYELCKLILELDKLFKIG